MPVARNIPAPRIRIESEFEARRSARRAGEQAFIPTYSSFPKEMRTWIIRHQNRLERLQATGAIGRGKIHRTTAIRDLMELAYAFRTQLGVA